MPRSQNVNDKLTIAETKILRGQQQKNESTSKLSGSAINGVLLDETSTSDSPGKVKAEKSVGFQGNKGQGTSQLVALTDNKSNVSG